ncbi:MAG: APC family permease [Deltaproteobacteria bacterium]|nr:APC family permease [Deltaproteobacteria bacterium]
MSGGDDRADRHPRDRLRRELGLGAATLLAVSSVVGSGIFFTPGRIAGLLPGVEWIFALWLVGGLLSLAGALANAELGAMYPHAGGDYVYLREAFHPSAGFLVGWLTFFAIYAGTIATLAAAFGEGLGSFLGYDTAPGSTGVLVVAVAVTVGTSLLNYVGLRYGAWANNITASVKILALLALAAVAPFTGQGDVAHFQQVVPDLEFSASAFGLALSPVLFTYLGWNAAIYVASEIKNPGRNVPRSLFFGLAICTGLYLVLNAVYIYAMPLAELSQVANAGEASARALLGPLGGTVVAVFVLASILGTLNATVLVGPRIPYAMALDHLFFRGVDATHPRFGTPHIAIVLQGLVSVVLLGIFQGFPDSLFASALDYTVFAIVLATMADTLALYRLRRLQPDRPRPYRAWGYPWVPAIYIAVNAWIAFEMLRQRPFECAVGLAVVATGWPFYVAFRRRASGPGEAPADA